MADQPVSQLKTVRLRIPVPSVAAVRARAWMIVPPLLFGLLGALIATQRQGQSWRAEAEVVLSETSDPDVLAPTLASLARSHALVRQVVRVAQVPGLTTAEFPRHSDVRTSPDNALLILSVSFRQRTLAVRITNIYAQQFAKRLSSGIPQPVAHLGERARVRTASSSRPHALRSGLVGGAIGVLLGAGLLLAIVMRRRKAR